MKLHGIAIAAAPRKSCDGIIDITCTTVSLSGSDVEEYETVDDYTFTTSFDSTHTADILRCCTRIVNTIDSVLILQRHEAKNGQRRPVALCIGHDSRTPVNAEALFVHLFGRRFSKQIGEAEIREILHIEKTDVYGAPIYRLPFFVPKGVNKKLEDRLIENGKISPGEGEQFIAEICAINEKLQSEITGAFQTREKFLSGNYPSTGTYKAACRRLPELLQQCTLRWGSFAPGSVKEVQEHGLDAELIGLKAQMLAGDPKAHQKLIGKAKREGIVWGYKVSAQPNLFWRDSHIPGYRESKELQDKHPRDSYFYWHNDYRAAFYQGFNQSHSGVYSKHIKLPLDALNPPFVDPVLERLLDEKAGFGRN